MDTNENLRADMSAEDTPPPEPAVNTSSKNQGTRKARRRLFPDLTLDLRLGARMLVKYPGITIIGGFAMAFAIWTGCITFDMVNLLLNPRLPLPDGDRIVQISAIDVAQSSVEQKILHDYISWRGTLRTVTELGAYRDQSPNLIARPGDARPVATAEITANAFRLAPEPPLLGRTLLPEDERAGAPHVVVIGYETWRSRFNSDRAVVGQTVQLGEVFATIVGVMPEGFEFPVSHDAWTPLRTDALEQTPRAGPPIKVFGRLAPNVSIEQAQAELTTIGQRAAAKYPDTHKNLQPRVHTYTSGPMQNPDLLMAVGIPGFAVMLLILVCGNVALLMFARAATRESELIVRTALGASRGRIVIQLFAEALVLGGIAAAVGLAAAEFALRQWGTPFLEANMGRLPFWTVVQLSPSTVVYAIALTVLASVIAGVVPALKVTSGLSARLRQVTAGAGGLKFGGVWTAVIITQIAFTTAFPAMLLVEQFMLSRVNTSDPGFAAEQYLAVRIEPDPVSPGDDAASVAQRKAVGDRFIPALERLRQRALTDAAVAGVTFVDRLPRDWHRSTLFELDTTMVAAATSITDDGKEPLREAHLAFIDASYFDVLQVPMIAGRAFQPADFVPEYRVVIVDQGFVEQVLHGRNAVGQRIRFVDGWAQQNGEVQPPQPWLEIVGVVKELGLGSPAERGRAAGVYTPVTPGHQGPTNMMVHVRGDPMSFIPQLRKLATETDPTLRLSEFKRVDQVTDSMVWVLRLWLKLTALLTAIALILSLAGIYAVMSFTVSRRTREIGIRVALGANARRVVASIFKRPLTQVAIGVVTGAALAGLFLTYMVSCQDGVCENTGFVTPTKVVLLMLYVVVVFGICTLACIVPTRRALAVQPTEALRAE
jgi:predicted permease